jgi:hypothetical protein
MLGWGNKTRNRASDVARRPAAMGRDRDLEAAIAWAREERRRGRVEEFSVGPTTLEDVYVRLIQNEEAVA